MFGAAFFCQYHTHPTIQNYHKMACKWFRSNETVESYGVFYGMVCRVSKSIRQFRGGGGTGLWGWFKDNCDCNVKRYGCGGIEC